MTPQPFVEETQKCRIAQLAWVARSVRERLHRIRSFRHLLAEAADELTAAVEKDVARPPAEVLGSDVLPLAAAAKFLEKHASRLLAPQKVHGTPLYLFGQKDVVHRRPWGVVGIIGTWNYPVFLNGVQLLQALAAGNGVLWKPSEYAATSAAIMFRLLSEAGFPLGLVQLLPAEREAGPRLLESDIDHLVFTGSAAVGRKIAVRLAERLIPSTLELSGVDAMFVLDDADVALAARAAWFGLTLNRGQTCLAVRRIFVQRGVHDALIAALRPMVENAEPMALVAQSQIEQAKNFINDAASKGGLPLKPTRCNGWALNECPPHIILNATPDMDVCRIECFAPLTTVMTFDTIEHAITMDQQCPFALGASVFTRDTTFAQALAKRLRAGSVGINDLIVPITHPATPFGGRGASGWGVTQGADGLLATTTPQVVSCRRGTFRPHFSGPTPGLTRLLHGMLTTIHAKGTWRRMRGVSEFWRTRPND
jgi:acyl-CoA reductase-like NAD-dependent aldehyde dehydrogenase